MVITADRIHTKIKRQTNMFAKEFSLLHGLGVGNFRFISQFAGVYHKMLEANINVIDS